MADNKSSEGKITTLECMECGFREVFTERQFKIADGLRCYKCEGLVSPAITRHGEEINNRRMKQKKRSVGELTVVVDVSDALKGLKAIQREAKKATAAIKELDNIRKHTCPECKTISLNIDTLNSDNGPVMQSKRCTHCSYEEVINIE